jgi:hypothetical protein
MLGTAVYALDVAFADLARLTTLEPERRNHAIVR